MHIGCVYSVTNFLSKNKPLDTQLSIPFGISYIATALKEHNHEPHILVFSPQMNIEKIVHDFINKYQPPLFCLTATSSQFHLIIRVAAAIKKSDATIFVVLGGVHASLNPEETIKNHDIDALCLGEGEKAITKLADYLESRKQPVLIPNLWIKNTNTGIVEKNPSEDFIMDLDKLPFIDRKLWYGWIQDLDFRPSILAGRGCPNRCSYCSNHALSKVAKGKYVRFRSPENIVNEITQMVEDNPKIHSIYLEIETISVNLHYAYKLFASLQKFNEMRHIPLEFGANVSPVKKIIENEDFFIQLKNANFTSINIGLESGSERVRKEILHRPFYTNEDIIAFCSLAKKYGIKVMVNVLIGIPGETKEDFLKTIGCFRECGTHILQLGIYEPYPGTDLYNCCIEQGLFTTLNTDIFNSERCRAYMNLPGFSKSAIQLEYLLFNFRVWGFRALRNYKFDISMIKWFLDQLLFGHLKSLQLLQKIRDKKIGKMQLSDFE